MELELCTRVAERYPKNYYAWTHRLVCMRKHSSIPLLKREWKFCLAWIPKHVSDHSAIHCSGQVLLQLLQMNDRLEMDEILENAMQESKRLVQVHPAHEVLWIFRRVCALAMLKLLKGTVAEEYFTKHIANEWDEVQQSTTPRVGSEVELEWRKTHAYRLSYIVWISDKCGKLLNDHTIEHQALQRLSGCDFIPHNMWRIKDTT